MTQVAIKSPNVCFCTTWGKQTKHNACQKEWKTSINSIYPNLWAPTADLLQGLTVLQQFVFQMKFRNVCEVKKWLVEPGLVWRRTLSILLSMNGESVSLPVFA